MCAQNWFADNLWVTLSVFGVLAAVLIYLIVTTDGPSHQKKQ